ncbi:hypothetical protein BHE74_00053487 [Ensete ventricosum]|nr:hypothetical protein BHE74_00053487 [Ensete ventricosum]RZS28160.1 hypothetical protein BHM03_00061724 [Ensete ventricosum]
MPFSEPHVLAKQQTHPTRFLHVSHALSPGDTSRLDRANDGARGRRIRFVEGKGAARLTIDHGIRCVEPIVTGRIEAPPDRAPFAIRRRVSGSQPSRLERWVRGLGAAGEVCVFLALLFFSVGSSDRVSRLVDLYLGFEELDGGEDDPRAEFPCPFCSEDFDIVGLCCHIDDEHPVEAKNGV